MKAYKLKTEDRDSFYNRKDELRNKETRLTFIYGGEIEGVIRNVSINSISLSRYDNWGNVIEIPIRDIKDIEVSEYPYFSMEHNRSLRQQKIARFPFRYNEENLSALKGNFVFVNYDGKLIDGEIIKVKSHYNKKVIIVRTKNEIKEINCYQLRSLEITGKTKQEHEGAKKLRRIEADLLYKLETEFYEGSVYSFDENVVNPDDLLDRYFEAKIKALKNGVPVDYKEFDYSWTQEIFNKANKDMKETAEEINKAKSVNKYYNNRVRFIEYLFKHVSEVDWTEYSKKQTEGELHALKYLYESGIVLS